CDRPNPDFFANLERSPERLRIAVVRSAMFGSDITPEVRTALGHAVKLLQKLGHEVEDAEPEIDYAQFRLAFLTYWTVGIKQILDHAAETLGRVPVRRDIEYATWGLANVGGAMKEADKSRARRTIWNAAKVFTAFFERHDILLSPVLAELPLRIGQNSITGVE